MTRVPFNTDGIVKKSEPESGDEREIYIIGNKIISHFKGQKGITYKKFANTINEGKVFLAIEHIKFPDPFHELNLSRHIDIDPASFFRYRYKTFISTNITSAMQGGGYGSGPPFMYVRDYADALIGRLEIETGVSLKYLFPRSI